MVVSAHILRESLYCYLIFFLVVVKDCISRRYKARPTG